MSPWHLKQAAGVIRRGGVIAYPTEAVWGLGCDPFRRDAVERILALKARPMHKGLILIAGCMEEVEFLLAPLSGEQRAQLEASWPGPVTWLIPDPEERVPHWVRGSHASVAVRVSAHPLVQQLCRAVGGPVVSTSANPAGEEPARTAREVRLAFGRRLDYLLPGRLGGLGKPSEIRDLLNGRVIRPGG